MNRPHRDDSFGPQPVEGKGDGVERGLADGVIVLQDSQQHPAALFIGKNLQGAGIGVDQPEVDDALATVDRDLLSPVGTGGAGAEDLAHPVRRWLEPGGIGQTRQALAPPSGEVRDQDVVV
jgi:hypothetical protein